VYEFRRRESPQAGGTSAMKDFEHLTEQEVLALAITAEEEDERFYADVAESVRQNFPASAKVFEGMREEESNHRRRLIELYQQKFGEHIPVIRRQEVRGFIERKSLWMLQPINLERIRKQVGVMELESGRFYRKAPPVRRTPASASCSTISPTKNRLTLRNPKN
jgi:rubrerythrin